MNLPFNVRYDGVQGALFGDMPLHCFTITDPASPAFGASFCIETTAPTVEAIAAAAAVKEAQFSHPVPPLE